MKSSDRSPFRGLGVKIFLIGFMGSGKTHWGRVWAKENQQDFYDLDELIEKEEKRSIATIFEKNGEDHFRTKETMVLKKFTEKINVINAGRIETHPGFACPKNYFVNRFRKHKSLYYNPVF